MMKGLKLTMQIQEILSSTIKQLNSNNVEEPNNKAKRLLAFVLNVPKEFLIINDNKELNKKQEVKYKKCIERLIKGEPIQYIIGKQEFMGIDLIVTNDVLIPQPDTEILVEETIKVAKQYDKPKILDLCTGSGAIAIAIKKYIPEAEIVASDLSSKALRIANNNDRTKKIRFILSDLFENINEKFDIIVSNPPYIKTEEIKTLSKEVQNEPLMALDGGQDGLYFYEKIIKQANSYLNQNSYLCLEIGENQKNEIIKKIQYNGKYTNIQTYKDLGGNDRVITCKKS
jgi:release factor glutamine methyltransferase